MTEDMKMDTVVALLRDQPDPINVLYAASLMGLTKGLWKVSGAGSAGVTRAFGEDIWRLIKIGSTLLKADQDTSNPQKAMEFYDSYLIGRFNVADSMDYNVTDDSIEITVKNCRAHHYTDYLEENDVPRSVGCPLALGCVAMMEEVTGNPFIVDSIESKDGNSKIILKKF
ncbi:MULTISPECIES: hypothetical protein [Methanobacterium]|jgi:hypothetical protein|uniref:Uncharacterized protein n=1 Tax=Methanobacterium veterum TaxID=408577 RepID=A0A9E5DMA0_9EURY|nr:MULTISPECIES: hypothetical protein [Methanobacterium]MCZ3366475.1 hypothetical protein [Methanobacterium veterum]MCZ3371983.1 hypothetical protein [Methanobacterium veterum]